MKNSIISALTERSFLLAWLAEVFTLVSTHIFNFLVILVVFELTRSNTASSGVVLTITIPSIIFGVVAGAFVDRWNKKRVLIVVNIARALLLVFLAFNIDNLFLLYAITFIFSFITQFFIPAELPIIPLIVEKKHLYSANALFGMAIYGSILIAYALSGTLIIMLGPDGALALLAVMLGVASALIFFIKLKYSNVKLLKNGFEDANIFEDLKYTLTLISKTKDVLQAIFFLALSQTLVLVIATIAPGYASSVLLIPTVQFPLLFVAPAAAGVIIGAWFLIKYLQNVSRQMLITIGIFLSGVSILILPYGSKAASQGIIQSINLHLPAFFQIDVLHIVILLAFLLGISNSLVFVPANTLLQEMTTEAFRGKVYGFLNAFIGALSLLPVILVGGLADILGVGAVITGIGYVVLFIGIIRFFVR